MHKLKRSYLRLHSCYVENDMHRSSENINHDVVIYFVMDVVNFYTGHPVSQRFFFTFFQIKAKFNHGVFLKFIILRFFLDDAIFFKELYKQQKCPNDLKLSYYEVSAYMYIMCYLRVIPHIMYFR